MSKVDKIGSRDAAESVRRANRAGFPVSSADSVGASSGSHAAGSSTDNPFPRDPEFPFPPRRKRKEEAAPEPEVFEDTSLDVELLTNVDPSEIQFESENMRNVTKYETNRDSPYRYPDNSIEDDI